MEASGRSRPQGATNSSSTSSADVGRRRGRDRVLGACPERRPKHYLDGHSNGTDLRQVPIPDCGGLISDPTTIGCFGPSWSPDGRKIVFERRSADQNDVYTVNADGTDPSEVSGTPFDEGGPPDWGTHPLIAAR
jgi:WD40-like Beta Propeller Repeat